MPVERPGPWGEQGGRQEVLQGLVEAGAGQGRSYSLAYVWGSALAAADKKLRYTERMVAGEAAHRYRSHTH